MLRHDSRLKPLVRRSLSETNNKQFWGAEDITQLIECLPRVHEALSSVSSAHKLRVVIHTSNPSSGEVKGGKSQVQDQAAPHAEL